MIKKLYLWLVVCFFGDSLTEEEIQDHLDRLRNIRKTASAKQQAAIANEITYWNARLLGVRNG